MTSEEEGLQSSDQKMAALLYQFAKLYEKWSDDRQSFTANMAKQEEFLNKYGEKLAQFEKLEPEIRKQLVNAILIASKNMAENVSEKINNLSTTSMDKNVKELKQAISDASQTLRHTQAQVKNNTFKTFALTVGTSVLSSLLIVWLILSKPLLPFTGDMLHIYAKGTFIDQVWPYIPLKTQKQINEISVSRSRSVS